MKRAFAVVALLVAAVVTWLALRGDAPPTDSPAAAAKPERAAPRKRTGPVESVPTGTPADAPTVPSDDDAAKPSTLEPIEVGGPVETAAPRPLDGTEPIAVGRLVDGNGAPIAGFAVVAHVLDVGEEWSPLVPCTTGADGRFRFVLKRPKGDPTTPKLEIGRRVVASNSFSTMRRVALIDLPPTLPSGEIVVGDVAYRGNALLVAGVVVDADGRPLRDAEIRAMNVDIHSRCPTDDDAAVTDAAGRFRLLGEPKGTSVALGAKLDGFYVPEHAPFVVGATDARIVMSPAGGIAGSVQMPPGQKRVTIYMFGPPGDNGDTEFYSWERRRCAANEDGSFEIRGLRPGAARVSIRLGFNEEDGIASVDDVQVVAGRITRDPRLQDVDPLKSTSTLNVVAVNKDGLGLPAHVYFRPAGKTNGWKDAGEGSTTTVRTRREAIAGGLDVLVRCGGFRSKIAREVRADTTVVLETAAWTSVRVRLAESTPLPPPPYQFSAMLYWIEPGAADAREGNWDPRDSRVALAGFGKDRVLTLEGIEPGRYRVVLFLGERDMNSSSRGSIDSDPKVVVVTVGEDGATGEVVVGADAGELARQTKRSR